MRFTRIDTAPLLTHSVSVTRSRTLPGELEALIGPEARVVLHQFGDLLDHYRTVRVRKGGFVAFERDDPAAQVQETEHEQRQGTSRPAARSRQGAAGRQGQAGRSRQAGSRSRFRSLRSAYEEQLDELEKAYPTLRVFPDDDGMWLLAQSSVMDGLNADATFLVGLPFHVEVGPRAWGFWNTRDGLRWIGDRHTNFFDGSICAFSPDDGAWAEGGELDTLLNLYTVWAMRHLHLEVIGRWPGRQHSLPHPYYRLIEIKPDELCTCGIRGVRYGDCCRPKDVGNDFMKMKIHFEAWQGGRIRDRAPPAAVSAFIESKGELPRLRDVHESLQKRWR